MEGNSTGRIERLEAVLRAAHDRRETPPPDPGMILAVLDTIKMQPEPATNGVLWRMAAGAGLVAVATIVVTLVFGSGIEDEVVRFLFYDPNGQALVSLFGV
jgi:hypothetical protein